MIANRGQMAAILGVTEPTLDRMVQRREVIGKKRGNKWEFDTKAVIAKLVKDASKNTVGSKKGNTELRIALADAELKEFKVAEMRKVMIHIDDVAPLFDEQLTVIKSLFSAAPSRLYQRLAVETDPAEVLRVLKEEVSEVLKSVTETEAKRTHRPATAKPIDPETMEDEPEGDEDDGDEEATPEEVPAPNLTEDGY